MNERMTWSPKKENVKWIRFFLDSLIRESEQIPDLNKDPLEIIGVGAPGSVG